MRKMLLSGPKAGTCFLLKLRGMGGNGECLEEVINPWEIRVRMMLFYFSNKMNSEACGGLQTIYQAKCILCIHINNMSRGSNT